MQKKVILHIYNTDLVWQGMIEAFESFVFRQHWNEIVYSELRINRKAQGVDQLILGRFISVNNDPGKMLIIEDMTTNLEEEIWTFNCPSMNALLNYRIVHYNSVDDQIDEYQSWAMMEIVEQSLVTGVTDVNRKFLKSDDTTSCFYVAPYKSFGDRITFEPDAKFGYLGDAMTTISNMHEDTGFPVGWSVDAHSTFSTLRFDTLQHVNKTINQTAVPPVIFSEEFGNIKNAQYVFSIKDWKNCAYVWHEFEGSPADYTMILNYIKYGSAKSFNRREIVLDGKSKTSAGIIKEGKAFLNKSYKVESFTAEIVANDNTMTTFELDWNLGDIVTIQSNKLNPPISLDTQIVGTEEIYENGEYTLNATFGNSKVSFIKLIKNAIDQRR